MINIAQKADELITKLKKEGFKGFRCEFLQRECEEDWTNNYAIIENIYLDTYANGDGEGDEYFDFSRLEYDFKKMLKEHSQELEVYRLKNGRVLVEENTNE